MIHAGVTDSHQWNNEFTAFSQNYQVIRYDLRGYGKSEPFDGEFSYKSDLVALLNVLEIHGPLVLMGCSMGGDLAMDSALMHQSLVKALIMVDAGPSRLELDVATFSKFVDAKKAFEAGNMDLVAEIERLGLDSGWYPTWEWGQYPEAWAAARPEWAGKITVETLHALRAFDMITACAAVVERVLNAPAFQPADRLRARFIIFRTGSPPEQQIGCLNRVPLGRSQRAKPRLLGGAAWQQSMFI
jgi:pimeloyl-ACP methyl ester carboxylesterase